VRVLRVATTEQVDQIYRESYRLWGAGLSFEDYLGLWREIESTRWGKRCITFLVWCDERGTVLSSLKLYRPLIRTGQEIRRGAVLGAVYTPKSNRRQGHAAGLIRAVLDRCRERGDGPALLFSDVGIRYYAALGFRPLPADEVRCRIPRPARSGTTAISLEPARDEDLDDVLRAHRDTSRNRCVAIVRDREHAEYLSVRTDSFFRRLGDPDAMPRSLVARSGSDFVGYLWTVEGRGEWSVREAGAVGGEPRVIAEILRSGAAHAARRGLRKLHGWIPEGVSSFLADWDIRRESRTRAVPMLAALCGRIPEPGDAPRDRWFIPFPDQF